MRDYMHAAIKVAEAWMKEMRLWERIRCERCRWSKRDAWETYNVSFFNFYFIFIFLCFNLRWLVRCAALAVKWQNATTLALSRAVCAMVWWWWSRKLHAHTNVCRFLYLLPFRTDVCRCPQNIRSIRAGHKWRQIHIHMNIRRKTHNNTLVCWVRFDFLILCALTF